MDTKYNGWTNYETWACALWIDNDEPMMNVVLSCARSARDTPQRLGDRTPEGLLTDALNELVEEGTPELPNSMYSDLLNAALSSINFYELAKHYLQVIDES